MRRIWPLAVFGGGTLLVLSTVFAPVVTETRRVQLIGDMAEARSRPVWERVTVNGHEFWITDWEPVPGSPPVWPGPPDESIRTHLVGVTDDPFVGGPVPEYTPLGNWGAGPRVLRQRISWLALTVVHLVILIGVGAILVVDRRRRVERQDIESGRVGRRRRGA